MARQTFDQVDWVSQVASILNDPLVELQTALDSLAYSACVLDRDGSILHTNRRWREFALENGGEPQRTNEGMNYLAVCQGSDEAQAARECLTAVLNGTSHEAMFFNYPCHSSDEMRWFVGSVSRFDVPLGCYFIVSHQLIGLQPIERCT